MYDNGWSSESWLSASVYAGWVAIVAGGIYLSVNTGDLRERSTIYHRKFGEYSLNCIQEDRKMAKGW